MKMNFYWSVLSILLIWLSACSTPAHRSPAQTESEHIYRYSDHFTCADEKMSTEFGGRTKWSALSGLSVGARSFVNWQNSEKRVLRPFSSDGCSVSFDGIPGSEQSRKWTQCCVEHDVAYWIGGTESDREVADDDLQRCIAKRGYPDIGKIYGAVVKKFGGPDSSQTFRWGYGWNDRRPYSPLSRREELMIQDEYGQNVQSIKLGLKANFVSLVRVCDTFDYGLKNLSSDEDEIYKTLSEKVKSADIIEWAKPGYFNFEKREYLVKLKSCASPVAFRFFTDRDKSPDIVSECGNL